MNFKNTAALLIITGALLKCEPDKNPSAANEMNLEEISFGRSWFYRACAIDNSSQRQYNLDTTWSYSYLSYCCDTTINGCICAVIQGVEYRCFDFYIDTITISQFICITDSQIKIIEPKGAAPPYLELSLLKQRAIDTAEYDSSNLYDTSLYSDVLLPIVFPIEKGLQWFYRPLNDPNGSLPMVRRFIGNETVTVPGGTFNCWKFDFDYTAWWINDPPVPKSKTPPVACTTWVSSIGNVKTATISKKDTILHSSGTKTITSDYKTVGEYMGDSDLSDSYVKPALANAIIDSLASAIKDHWQFAAFINWLKSFGTSQFYKFEYETYYESYALRRFTECVWGIETNSVFEAADVCTTQAFPDSAHSFASYSRFIAEIMRSQVFDCGWDDCATIDTACTSSLRLELLKYAYGE